MPGRNPTLLGLVESRGKTVSTDLFLSSYLANAAERMFVVTAGLCPVQALLIA